jgi:hypothetical protein
MYQSCNVIAIRISTARRSRRRSRRIRTMLEENKSAIHGIFFAASYLTVALVYRSCELEHGLFAVRQQLQQC